MSYSTEFVSFNGEHETYLHFGNSCTKTKQMHLDAGIVRQSERWIHPRGADSPLVLVLFISRSANAQLALLKMDDQVM